MQKSALAIAISTVCSRMSEPEYIFFSLAFTHSNVNLDPSFANPYSLYTFISAAGFFYLHFGIFHFFSLLFYIYTVARVLIIIVRHHTEKKQQKQTHRQICDFLVYTEFQLCCIEVGRIIVDDAFDWGSLRLIECEVRCHHCYYI